MAHVDLRDWLPKIEDQGVLKHVRGATWQEDIGRITEMLHHTPDAPAVLFDEIPGYPKGWRVLVNAMGARRNLALTLGLDPAIGPFELMDIWEQRLGTMKYLPPVEVQHGPILENVLEGDAIDLYKFPTPFWHAEDGGRYIGTGCLDITRDPDGDWVNFGTYRVMIQDKQTTGIYISPGKHGRIHRDKWLARGEAMPICIVVGSDPLLFVASCIEVPLEAGEYDFVGGLRGRPVEVIREKHTGLPIPAHAEIVIAGFVHPTERRPEGPFGEWTGYYASGTRGEPIIQVKAVYHRNDPILYGCPPNKPPYEAHRFRVYLRSAMLRKQLKDAGVPGIKNVWCHEVGGCRMLNVVGIEQLYPGHARQAALLASQVRVGAYMNKWTVVVDDDIDVTDLNDVIWACLTRADPIEDFEILRRCWSTPLDPAIHPDRKGLHSRVVIDACRPWEWRQEFPHPIGPSPEFKRETREQWGWILK